MRQRLLRPSLDLAEIEARLDAVSDLVRETIYYARNCANSLHRFSTLNACSPRS